MRLYARASDEVARNVRRLSVARFISTAGSQAAMIALIAIVYERTDGSGAWLTAALVGSFVVRLLVGPLVGALGDRFDRRLVMVVSDLVAGLAFIGLAAAHSPVALVSLAMVAAAAEAPFGPAANAQLAMVVPEDQRASANASRSAAAGAAS
jgi:MFS family permease